MIDDSYENDLEVMNSNWIGDYFIIGANLAANKTCWFVHPLATFESSVKTASRCDEMW